MANLPEILTDEAKKEQVVDACCELIDQEVADILGALEEEETGLSVPELLGRVVNALGQPIDGKGPINAKLTDKIWAEVKPLYDDLHCYTRTKLNEKYGDAVQAKTGPIRADLLDVADVVACSVAHNPTGALDALGRPPHSVEATVQFTPGLAGVDLDAARLAVATQLFASVAAGIDTYGDHSTTVLDPQGDPQTVRWTEPTLVSIWVEMSLTIDPATYAGDAAVKDAVLAFGDTLRLGDDVVRARLLCALVDVPGVLDVPALTLGVTATELYPQNVVINARALAAFDTSRITVTS